MYLRKIGFDTLRGFSFKSIQHLHPLDFLCHSLHGIRTGTNLPFYISPKLQYCLVIYDGIFIIHINVILSFLSPSFYFANTSANLASVCTIFSVTYKIIVCLIYLLFTYFIPCSNSNVFIFFSCSSGSISPPKPIHSSTIPSLSDTAISFGQNV